MKFECHITIHVKDGPRALAIAEALSWSTSEIARDPALGPKPYFYLTCHGDDYLGIYSKMEETCTKLGFVSIFVLRKKIELIMYDALFQAPVDENATGT